LALHHDHRRSAGRYRTLAQRRRLSLSLAPLGVFIVAIYANTPYDPAVHSAVPANFRSQWKHRTNRPLDLTDAEIWTIWRDAINVTPEPGQSEDDLVLELLGDALDQKESGNVV
jgi:hypothetical protein